MRVMSDEKNKIMLNEIMDLARNDLIHIDNIISMHIIEVAIEGQDEGALEAWLEKYIELCDYEALITQSKKELIKFCNKMIEYVADRYFSENYWECKKVELEILEKFKKLLELTDKDSIAEVEADYFLTDFKQAFEDFMEYEVVCHWIDKLNGKDKSARRI